MEIAMSRCVMCIFTEYNFKDSLVFYLFIRWQVQSHRRSRHRHIRHHDHHQSRLHIRLHGHRHIRQSTFRLKSHWITSRPDLAYFNSCPVSIGAPNQRANSKKEDFIFQNFIFFSNFLKFLNFTPCDFSFILVVHNRINKLLFTLIMDAPVDSASINHGAAKCFKATKFPGILFSNFIFISSRVTGTIITVNK